MVKFTTVFSASAAVLVASLPVFASHAFVNLLPRQSAPLFDPSSLPASCLTACNATSNAIDTCPDTQPTCICSNTVAKNMADCLNCAVSIQGSTVNVSTAQNIADEYRAGCKAGGVSINPITINGNVNGSNTTTSPGGGGGTSPPSSATRASFVGGVILGAFALVVTFA